MIDEKLAICQLADMETKHHPLAEARIRKGDLTQEQVAEMVGASKWTINRIECGKRQPSISLAKKLSAALEIPVSALRPDIFAEAAE